MYYVIHYKYYILYYYNMNFQDGPSTSFNTQKSMKTNILSDSELLDILETSTFCRMKTSALIRMMMMNWR